MMPKDIKSYLKIYKDFLDPNLCKETVKNLSNSPWQKHHYHNPSSDTEHSYDDDLFVTHEEIPEKNEINQLVWKALEKYVVKDFKDLHKWFSGWNGYTHIRFNRYDPSTQMRIHCDHIHTVFDGQRKGVPILTILGSLNNDYTGGEFVMWEDEIVELPAGAIAIFPSNFLYPHEVRPVKTGVRYSYVSWAW
jgi:predicted 2-oxoglutarate/Fe(II)-dependent dioxygenase YbiX